jgi:hypothetical protein
MNAEPPRMPANSARRFTIQDDPDWRRGITENWSTIGAEAHVPTETDTAQARTRLHEAHVHT